MARAYDLPDGPGMSEEFDFRTYDHVGRRSGRSPSSAIPVAAPGRGLRPAGHGGGRHDRLHRRHGACAALDRLAAGADLLLAEASFRDGDDNPPEIHLTGTDGGELAARAGVGRLVITHIPPWFDKAGHARRGAGGVGRPGRPGPAGRVYEL